MLKKYTNQDFKIIKAWVQSTEELFQFAGTDFTYPLTAEQIERYQSEYPDRHLYMAFNNSNEAYAFGEIIPQGDHPRLGRLIIKPELRGKGYGTYFLHLLAEKCKMLYKVNKLDLFVLEENKQAIRCYENAGFEFTPENFAVTFNEIEYPMKKMSLILSNN